MALVRPSGELVDRVGLALPVFPALEARGDEVAVQVRVGEVVAGEQDSLVVEPAQRSGGVAWLRKDDERMPADRRWLQW
jgi:hypothetical protein